MVAVEASAGGQVGEVTGCHEGHRQGENLQDIQTSHLVIRTRSLGGSQGALIGGV